MDPNQNNAGAPTLVIMAFLMGIVGVAVQNDPLKSSRPPNLKNFSSEYTRLQDVDSRLWQDPLMATQNDINEHKKENKHEGGNDYKAGGKGEIDLELNSNDKNAIDLDLSIKLKGASDEPHTLCDSHSFTIFNKFRDDCFEHRNYEDKVTFLGITARWGPYLRDQENRRRVRYAVLSGMGASDFLPEDPKHIGYIKTPKEKAHIYPEYIPFEILKYTKGKERERVVLLWLDDSVFSLTNKSVHSQGILKFHDLVSELVQGGPGKATSFGPLLGNIELKLIGPTNSDSLKAWLQPVINDEACEKIKNNPIKIYSPFATVPIQQLDLNFYPNNDHIISACLINSNGNLVKVELKRVGVDDQNLVDELKAELEARGIKFTANNGKPLPQIVLVSEWDTLYGRGFKDYLVQAFNLKTECHENEPESCPIKIVNYMSGLDGETSETSKSDSSNKKSTGKQAQKISDGNFLEMPYGNKQYDYLRRLGASLKEKNENLKQLGTKGLPPEYTSDIKAIGILGTDIYDKLLILQALKKDFPQAIFFTTDLKANLLNPDEYSSARNLLVVSSFGLQLSERLQNGIPPFRDNYQTATFLATRTAFSNDVENIVNQSFQNNTFKPRIFEIGRTHAIDISRVDPPENISENKLHQKKELQNGLGGYFFWYLILIIALCVILAFYPFREAKDFIVHHKRLVGMFAIIIFGFVITHVLIYKTISTNFLEEPLYWWEGVSVWPTNFIRLAGILLSWTFILLSVKWLDDSNKKLTDNYFYSGNTARTIIESKSSLIRLKNFFLLGVFHNDKDNPPRQPTDIWNEYIHHSSTGKKWARVLIEVAFFMSFLFMLVFLFNDIPNIPYRSIFSKIATEKIIIFAIFSFLTLLLFVVDEIRLSNKFIVALNKSSLDWSANTYGHLNIQQVQNNEAPGGESWDILFGNWIKVRLIARFTDTVDDLLYFPFIILFLLVISRFRIFDNWNMPLPLVIIISLNFLIALFYGFRLHSTAKKVKKKILHKMNDMEINLTGKLSMKTDHEGDKWDKEYLQKSARKIIEKTQAIKYGAFVPFWEQPILQSILIPFSGYGGFAILEYALFI